MKFFAKKSKNILVNENYSLVSIWFLGVRKFLIVVQQIT